MSSEQEIIRQEPYYLNGIDFLLLHRRTASGRECIAVPRDYTGKFHHLDRVIAQEKIDDIKALGFSLKYGIQTLDNELTEGVKESIGWWVKAMERRGLDTSIITR